MRGRQVAGGFDPRAVEETAGKEKTRRRCGPDEGLGRWNGEGENAICYTLKYSQKVRMWAYWIDLKHLEEWE